MTGVVGADLVILIGDPVVETDKSEVEFGDSWVVSPLLSGEAGVSGICDGTNMLGERRADEKSTGLGYMRGEVWVDTEEQSRRGRGTHSPASARAMDTTN